MQSCESGPHQRHELVREADTLRDPDIRLAVQAREFPNPLVDTIVKPEHHHAGSIDACGAQNAHVQCMKISRFWNGSIRSSPHGPDLLHEFMTPNEDQVTMASILCSSSLALLEQVVIAVDGQN